MAICRDESMPRLRTVYDWRDADESFAARFARAREEGYDAIAQDCLEIADETGHDTKEGRNGELIPDNEWITRSRLRVETRLKLLAKWSPKKYGEKVDVEHSGELKVKVTIGGGNARN